MIDLFYVYPIFFFDKKKWCFFKSAKFFFNLSLRQAFLGSSSKVAFPLDGEMTYDEAKAKWNYFQMAVHLKGIKEVDGEPIVELMANFLPSHRDGAVAMSGPYSLPCSTKIQFPYANFCAEAAAASDARCRELLEQRFAEAIGESVEDQKSNEQGVSDGSGSGMPSPNDEYEKDSFIISDADATESDHGQRHRHRKNRHRGDREEKKHRRRRSRSPRRDREKRSESKRSKRKREDHTVHERDAKRHRPEPQDEFGELDRFSNLEDLDVLEGAAK